MPLNWKGWGRESHKKVFPDLQCHLQHHGPAEGESYGERGSPRDRLSLQASTARRGNPVRHTARTLTAHMVVMTALLFLVVMPH